MIHVGARSGRPRSSEGSLEPLVPRDHRHDQILGLGQTPIFAKDAVDKLAAAGGAHGDAASAAIAYGELHHGVFARPQQGAKAIQQLVAVNKEVLDEAPLRARVASRPLGLAHIARQRDEGQPEVAGEGEGDGARAVAVHGPVVDPLSEGVGVEDRA